MSKYLDIGFDVKDSSAYFDTSIEDQAIGCLFNLIEVAENYMEYEENSRFGEVVKEAKDIIQRRNNAGKSK